MKVGTITFHGSHNYGSMLQAYALQKYIHELLKDHDEPCENLIINYRSEVQKRIYKAPEPTDLKNLLKWLLYLLILLLNCLVLQSNLSPMMLRQRTL